MILMNAFYNEQDLGDILNYKDKIMAITTDDIKRVAKKYLSDLSLIHIYSRSAEGNHQEMAG